MEYHKYLLLVRRCKSQTVSSYFQSIRMFFEWMCLNGMIQENPAQSISTKRRSIVRLNLSDEQIRQFGQYWVWESVRDYLLFILMVVPGLTPSELVKIKMTDVHAWSVSPFIQLSQYEYVCINPEILQVLRNYLKSNKD